MDINSYHQFIFMHLLFPFIACLLLSLLPRSLSYNLPPLCHQEERVALLQFQDTFIIEKNSFCGYPKVASWRIDRYNTNCCAWDGVECNQDTGHVITLDLRSSCLYGSITSNSSLFGLLHLQKLTLANNDFNHSQIPSEIGNLSSLTHLDLSNSHFSGKITSEIFHLPHLQELFISNNEDLTGHLPEFHTNSPLLYLVLDNTNFSGNLPASIGNLNSLIHFSIKNCSFSGTIPNSFSNLTQLTNLDLSQNSFNDLSWLTRASSKDILPQFEYLGLAHLNLTKFPYILRNQSKLESLDLQGNNLQGLIPKWMHNVSKESLQYFSLSNNFLTGLEDSFTRRISPFICNMSSLRVLDLSLNYLSGMIHPCMGDLSQSLLVLQLQSNNFSSTIPNTWAKGCGLKMIDLSQNQLQGHLPGSLANCTELEYLRLSGNQINDTYPFWLGTLQHLKILDLHSNGFHGAIRSSENYTFPNLHIINLSQNHFSGNLPVGYFEQWDAMKSVGARNLDYMGDWVYYSIIITIKGVELEFKMIHDGLTIIDFSCNRFEGEIPEKLGNLVGLNALNLSNNAFTGHIPSSFANLTRLESLDLSQNKLSGEIPPKLVQLSFLSKFNVSHNCLTGPIPQGHQFGTFPNTSFEDNRGLCGRPLSKICRASDISTPPPSTFEENQSPKLFCVLSEGLMRFCAW